MTYKFHLLVLLLLCLSVFQTAGQEACTSFFVRGIQVSDHFILTWTLTPQATCTASYYLVRILSRDVETAYTVEETELDVSFLPECENARFTITPVSSNDTQGSSSTISLNTPIPPDANLTIEYMRVSQVNTGSVTLDWELEEEWSLCVRRFRVVIINEDNDQRDVYVSDPSVTLHNIRPCELYTFTVRAIQSVANEGPISLLSYRTPSAKIDAPTLESLTLGTTSVDLKWQLDSYSNNRCAVSSIMIDASPSFSAGYPIRDDVARPILSTNITGLQADTMYLLNVTVINTAGPSNPFLVAIQTLSDV